MQQEQGKNLPRNQPPMFELELDFKEPQTDRSQQAQAGAR